MSKWIWLSVVLLPGATTSPARADEPIEIGSRRELLVDDHLIEQFVGRAELRLHRPTPREVAIVHDKPWEGNVCFYHTVFRDGDRYRMYYRGAHHDWEKKRVTHQVVCYAESEDGIRWTKPELGIVEFGGSKKNSILWDGPGSHNFAPFKDTNPACKPEAAYKAIAGGTGGLYPFESPDGIHWSLSSDAPVITKGAFDSQNLAFWDEVRGLYADYHRMGRDGVRDIMTATSTDFLHWTEPVFLEYPGAPKEHLYTNQIQPYYRAPHVLLGFPKRFVPSRKSPIGHPLPGVSDVVFMTSRDGQRFRRWTEAWIRPGPQPERWVCRNNFVAWGMVETQSALDGAPEELSFYSVEGYYQGETCQVRRYTLRIDGFVSLGAPASGGEVVTRPITFEGSELALNFSTSAAGGIRVELQNRAGEPLEGFSLADCPEIFGDTLERVVSFGGGTDISKLSGQPIRLRFVLHDADLFSFRVK
ncbi:MAG: hypothetical protein ABIP48_30725 [Planctomycetota bacterium]